MDQPISGWLNSSGRQAFNVLHDHGEDVEWSLVLFIRSGEEAAEPRTAEANVAGSAADKIETTQMASPEPEPGSLLLKMQLSADDASHFSYLSIKPVPGELWAFPGYVQRETPVLFASTRSRHHHKHPHRPSDDLGSYSTCGRRRAATTGRPNGRASG